MEFDQRSAARCECCGEGIGPLVKCCLGDCSSFYHPQCQGRDLEWEGWPEWICPPCRQGPSLSSLRTALYVDFDVNASGPFDLGSQKLWIKVPRGVDWAKHEARRYADLAGLQDHYVCPFYGLVRVKGKWLLVLKRLSSLSPEQFLSRYMKPLVALKKMHQQGTLMVDFKPEHCMLNEKKILLLDLDLAVGRCWSNAPEYPPGYNNHEEADKIIQKYMRIPNEISRCGFIGTARFGAVGVSLGEKPTPMSDLQSLLLSVFNTITPLPWAKRVTDRWLAWIPKARKLTDEKKHAFLVAMILDAKIGLLGGADVFMGEGPSEVQLSTSLIVKDIPFSVIAETIIRAESLVHEGPDGLKRSCRLLEGLIHKLALGSTPKEDVSPMKSPSKELIVFQLTGSGIESNGSISGVKEEGVSGSSSRPASRSTQKGPLSESISEIPLAQLQTSIRSTSLKIEISVRSAISELLDCRIEPVAGAVLGAKKSVPSKISKALSSSQGSRSAEPSAEDLLPTPGEPVWASARVRACRPKIEEYELDAFGEPPAPCGQVVKRLLNGTEYIEARVLDFHPSANLPPPLRIHCKTQASSKCRFMAEMVATERAASIPPKFVQLEANMLLFSSQPLDLFARDDVVGVICISSKDLYHEVRKLLAKYRWEIALPFLRVASLLRRLVYINVSNPEARGLLQRKLTLEEQRLALSSVSDTLQLLASGLDSLSTTPSTSSTVEGKKPPDLIKNVKTALKKGANQAALLLLTKAAIRSVEREGSVDTLECLRLTSDAVAGDDLVVADTLLDAALEFSQL